MNQTTNTESIPARLLLAPFRLRTWTNLAYLILAFPFGLAYFIAIVVGTSLGLGLSIIWIGLPILALVFGLVWLASGLERQLAISLLGARSSQAAFPDRSESVEDSKMSVWQRFFEYLSTPTTWSGLFYLTFIKFPFGVVTFVIWVTSLATSVAFLLAPLAYPWGGSVDFGMYWIVDTWIEAWICSLIGVVMLLGTLNLLNGLAALWRLITGKMLGLDGGPVVERVVEAAPAG